MKSSFLQVSTQSDINLQSTMEMYLYLCFCALMAMSAVYANDCEDKNKWCGWWSGRGECEKNPLWMLANCKVSCDNCPGTSACYNEHDNCAWWASVKQCKKNPGWMLKHCKRSCGVCTETTTQPPSTKPPTTKQPTTQPPTTKPPTTQPPTTKPPTTQPPTTASESGDSACPAKFQKIPDHSACLPKSPDATPVDWSQADKDSIVKQHNDLRAGVNPTATDMLKMTWDDELAMIAQGWANACNVRKGLSHDSGLHRSIPGGMSVGQNAASTVNYNSSIRMWWAEVDDYQFGVSSKEQWTTKMIGHYTQMAWGASNKVGCGAATCRGENAGQFLACNYGPAGNFGDFLGPYTSGESCSACSGHCSDGKLCDCGGLSCGGGKLDLATCTCDCSISGQKLDFLVQPDCALKCEGTEDLWWCEKDCCGDCNSAWVQSICPHKCGVC